MFTENGVLIDFEELRKVIDSCDVFTVGFRLFPERMIVDTRTTGEEGTMLEIVAPVGTVEERFFWLGQRRPKFGVPESFTFFIWPHSVRYLEESGMMDRIRQRIYPLDNENGANLPGAESDERRDQRAELPHDLGARTERERPGRFELVEFRAFA